jgi:hypothetical protein
LFHLSIFIGQAGKNADVIKHSDAS